MNESTKQEAIKAVILERFQKQRLPRILDIRNSVDAGNPLSKLDTEFLDEWIRDAQDNRHFFDDGPEDIQILFAKVVQLYKEITATALQIEQGSVSES